MTKSSPGKAVALLGVLLLAAAAQAHLNLTPPHAAIEYDAAQAAILHGSAEGFDKESPILLQDVAPNDGSNWLARGVGELTVLRGYAHVGASGLSQAQANANVARIQIWSWADTNGNGAADAGDTTTQWEKQVELTPATGIGNVVGHEVTWPLPAIHTSTWQGDLLQGNVIELEPGRSLLLLIRVVDTSGNTSLMSAVAGLEPWDNGVVDGVGSDVPSDAYLTADGHTPETTDARIEDDDVVWLYVPRLK